MEEMTLVRAAVEDFQSIGSAALDFGPFTVLLGPSNSGKSAFLRAVRACVRNSFVPSNVRSGRTKSVVTLTLAEASVTMERGKSLSTYRLGDEVYTKSARSVPEDVKTVLRMPEIGGLETSFSFQFDRPYLLGEVGTVAEQVIGSLTNASMLHDAVREANRRRGEASSELKLRTEDSARYARQLKEFETLPAELARAKKAEDLLSQAGVVEERRRALEQALRAYDEALFDLSLVDVPEVPEFDFDSLQESVTRLGNLHDMLTLITERASQGRSLYAQLQPLKDEEDALESKYFDILSSAGQCPICGQSTSELTHG